MNFVRNIFFFLLFLVAAGCSSVYVQNDYDTEFNFAKFKTYKIVNKTSTKAEAKLPTSLEFNRISRAVDKVLAKRGYVKKEIEPDFIVVFHTSVEKKLSVETTNYRRWQGLWISESEVREYKQGLLILDVVNRETKNVVWRGWMKGVEENRGIVQEEIDEMITGLLAGYPPKQK